MSVCKWDGKYLRERGGISAHVNNGTRYVSKEHSKVAQWGKHSLDYLSRKDGAPLVQDLL